MIKRKSLYQWLFVCCFLLFCSVQSVSAASVRVLLNNTPLSFDAAPYIQEDRVLVPLRGILDQLGYTVQWREHTNTVIATKGTTSISLTINKKTAIVNGKSVPLAVPATIKNERTFVPLRFLAEYSGAVVSWNEPTYTVSITTETDTAQKSYKDAAVLIQTNKMQGSGVILSENGLLVTNYHVIEGASMAQIVFQDGSVYQGETTVVGLSPSRDIALLKINKSGLTPAKLCTNIRQGEVVTAVTSPNGQRNTVTKGMITGFDQDVLAATTQINHGSSGGGLFNTAGELVGIAFGFTEVNTQYLFLPAKLIQQVPQTLSLPISSMKTYTYTPSAPQNLRYATKDGYAYVSWSPVYGADAYHVYVSEQPDGGFRKMENKVTDSETWLWGYPQCFGIRINQQLYLKVATVVNGVEVGFSDILYIH